MLPMLKTESPKVSLWEPNQLAPGVNVYPVNYAAKGISPPFRASIFHVEPNCWSPLDMHVVEESWYVLQGEGELEYAGTIFTITKQDVLFFSANQTHRVLNTSNEVLIIQSLYW